MFSAIIYRMVSSGRSDAMITHINLDNEQNQFNIIDKFFKKDYKIKYNKKLSGKIRLYISERNTIKDLSNIVTLYNKELH